MSAFGCCAPVTDTASEVIVNEPDAAGGERREQFEAANLKDKYFGEEPTWASARDFEGACLYGESGPKAADVLHHGKSKHGCFFAACSSLAWMLPAYIRDLIEHKGDGVYGVWLYSYAKSDWIQIDVHDWLLVDKNGKLAIGGLGKQIAFWPALLQQAAGQYIGSYLAMDKIDVSFALGMLTGCTPSYNLDKDDDKSAWSIYPYKPFTTDHPQDYDFDNHWCSDDVSEFPESEVISEIQDLLAKQYLMCVSSKERSISVLAVENGKLRLCDQAREEGEEDDYLVDYMAELSGEFRYITFVKFVPGA